MKFINGLKTYTAGVGSILFGLGGFLTGKLDPVSSVGFIAAGLATVGLRSFGQKLLDVLNTLKALK